MFYLLWCPKHDRWISWHVFHDMDFSNYRDFHTKIPTMSRRVIDINIIRINFKSKGLLVKPWSVQIPRHALIVSILLSLNYTRRAIYIYCVCVSVRVRINQIRSVAQITLVLLQFSKLPLSIKKYAWFDFVSLLLDLISLHLIFILPLPPPLSTFSYPSFLSQLFLP